MSEQDQGQPAAPEEGEPEEAAQGAPAVTVQAGLATAASSVTGPEVPGPEEDEG